MKILLQRVTRACVTMSGKALGEIGNGLLLLVGFGAGDSADSLAPMAQKVANLRVFPEGDKHFHLSLLETGHAVLAVSQFTLYAETVKGRRPDFFNALKPELAATLFTQFITELSKAGVPRIEQGEFGAMMQVELINDGPVTIMLEG